MKVTNKHTSPFALPNGQIVPANSTINVLDEQWEAAKHGDLVKAWLGTGHLVEGEPDDRGDGQTQAEGRSEEDAQPRKARPGRAEEGQSRNS